MELEEYQIIVHKNQIEDVQGLLYDMEIFPLDADPVGRQDYIDNFSFLFECEENGDLFRVLIECKEEVAGELKQDLEIALKALDCYDCDDILPRLETAE